jgi:hypothetical protein
VANANPSLSLSEAQQAVERENGIVNIVHMKDWRNGAIRYQRKPRGAILVQEFHRSIIQAILGIMPFAK